jgi:hypothetical protein
MQPFVHPSIKILFGLFFGFLRHKHHKFMETLFCDHGNSAPIEVLAKLHTSQVQAGQRKCVICAYQQGYQLGREKIVEPLVSNLEHCQNGKEASSKYLFDLPESQVEEGRFQHTIELSAPLRLEIDGVVGKFEKDKERAETVYFLLDLLHKSSSTLLPSGL